MLSSAKYFVDFSALFRDDGPEESRRFELEIFVGFLLGCIHGGEIKAMLVCCNSVLETLEHMS